MQDPELCYSNMRITVRNYAVGFFGLAVAAFLANLGQVNFETVTTLAVRSCDDAKQIALSFSCLDVQIILAVRFWLFPSGFYILFTCLQLYSFGRMGEFLTMRLRELSFAAILRQAIDNLPCWFSIHDFPFSVR